MNRTYQEIVVQDFEKGQSRVRKGKGGTSELEIEWEKTRVEKGDTEE